MGTFSTTVFGIVLPFVYYIISNNKNIFVNRIKFINLPKIHTVCVLSTYVYRYALARIDIQILMIMKNIFPLWYVSKR